jgi:hypothetical protein
MSVTDFPRSRQLRMGPEVNTFEEPTLVAVEAERDTYFSANPSNLAVYDGNSDLLIRLIYTDVEVITKFQQRLAGAWVDITPVVQGPSGSVASLAGVPVGEIPYKTITGEFAGSNMRVLEDGTVLAPPGFTVESGSVTFGEALTLSEISGYLGISNHINGNEYTVVDFHTPRDAPSLRPIIFSLNEPEFEFTAQAVDTTNLTDNPLQYDYTIQNTARVRAVKFRTFAPMTNVRMKITQVSNGVVLKYVPTQQAWQEGMGGLDWIAGDNTYDFEDTSLNFQAGTLIHFEIHATAVALKGNASGIPYFTGTIQRGDFLELITEADYEASDVRDKLTSLVGADRLSGYALKENVATVNTRTGDVVLDKTDVGLGNVDNTSDVNKPTSTAQQASIDLKMSQHNAAVDPHPQYTTTAEASAAAPVQSVNGLTGNVLLTTTNITEATNLYYTDTRVTTYLANNGYTVKSVGNVGTGSGVFKDNSSGTVNLRSIIGTGGITITQNTNDITVTAPILASGQYIPILNNNTNIDGSTSFQAQWLRVGDTVTVSGKVTIDPVQNNQQTILNISLPVASNLSAQEDLSGVAGCPAVSGQQAGIYADIVGDRAALDFVSGSTAIHDFFYHFSYQVI